MLRRYVRFMQVNVSSMNPVISALSYWGTRTRQSTTGRNVANMREEFGLNPLRCSPGSIRVKERDMPENGPETLELLERLFSIRAAEVEPDFVDEINALIDDICVT